MAVVWKGKYERRALKIDADENHKSPTFSGS